jgi:hypothetical protein
MEGKLAPNASRQMEHPRGENSTASGVGFPSFRALDEAAMGPPRAALGPRRGHGRSGL